MTLDPLVSIVIPAWNAEAHLATAIESLQQQTHRTWEAIVIDDGSGDDTLALAHRLAECDPRVRVLQNANGKGVSGARNTGLAAVRGEFICFLDADDTIDPEAIDGRLAGFRSTTEPHVVWYMPVAMVDEAGEDLGFAIGTGREYNICHYWQNPIHISAPLFRRQHLEKQFFPEEFENGEDWIFLARLAGSGLVFRCAPYGRGRYTIRALSTTKADLVGHALKLSAVAELIYRELALERVARERAIWVPPLCHVVSQRRIQASIAALVRGDALNGLICAADFEQLRRRRVLYFVFEIKEALEREYARYHVLHLNTARREIRKDSSLRKRIEEIGPPAFIRHSFLLALSRWHAPLYLGVRAARLTYALFRY